VTVTQTEHAPRPGRDTLVLWASLLVGPLAALAGQWVAYALVTTACERRSSVFVHGVHLVALILVGAGFVAGRRAWQRLGRGEAGEQPGIAGRARFMAVSAMISNVFFALVIVCFWLADFLVGPCLP